MSKKLLLMLWLNVILIIAFGVAWIVSYPVPFALVLNYSAAGVDFSTYRGQFSFGYERVLIERKGVPVGLHFYTAIGGEERHFELIITDRDYWGFGWLSYGSSLDIHDTSKGLATKDYAVMAPSWAIMILAALPFCFLAPRAYTARRRGHRARDGLCASCGYDLRAHKPGDKCPECGALSQEREKTPK